MISDERLVIPDYSNCLANIPNSVLRYFGAETVGDTLPLMDKYLAHGHRNVVLFLRDGMGTAVLEESLEEDGFFRRHFAESIDTVFLATTVAATTTAISGLQPCEHSWLGWDCYYPSVDKNVTVFLNTIQGTDIPAAEKSVANETAPYESVVSRINRAGGKAYESYPFAEPYPDSFEKVCGRIKELCAQPDRKYIYAYWNEPDSTLHKCGRGSAEAKELLAYMEKYIADMAEGLEDTLLIITADHGHMNNENVYIKDYPELSDCLVRAPSLEPRVLNLFVKEGREQEFEEKFNSLFGDRFVLMPMEKAYEMKLFGTGTEHESFRSMLGNYIAIAAGDLSIYPTDENWVSMHGSLTPEEVKIPFIVYES